MSNSDNQTGKWQMFREKIRPGMEKTGEIAGKIGGVLGAIGKWIWYLRKIFMAIPVVWVAIRMALYNQEALPEMVGINLQSNGEFAMMITRQAAVMGPLAVTGICLLLMCCSRRGLYPWLISIFTLILPVFLLITNSGWI